MGCEAQELANLLYKTIDTENYGLHLLPLRRVRAGNQGSLVSNLGQVAVMPVSFLVDRSIPVMVVAEWTGTTAASAGSVESCETMVALNRIRHSSRCRRSDRCGANTAEVFICGRSVVIDLCRLHDVLVKHGGLSWTLPTVVPR